MNLPAEKKMELIGEFLADFGKNYQLENVRTHADFLKNQKLPIRHNN
jgi:hypothetical protein